MASILQWRTIAFCGVGLVLLFTVLIIDPQKTESCPYGYVLDTDEREGYELICQGYQTWLMLYRYRVDPGAHFTEEPFFSCEILRYPQCWGMGKDSNQISGRPEHLHRP